MDDLNGLSDKYWLPKQGFSFQVKEMVGLALALSHDLLASVASYILANIHF